MYILRTDWKDEPKIKQCVIVYADVWQLVAKSKRCETERKKESDWFLATEAL